MQLNVIAIRRGPQRALQNIAAILAGKEPLLVGDNIRLDLSSGTPPGSPSDVWWSFFYGATAVEPDLTFDGDVDGEVAGDHFHLGGIGLLNLERSRGCTVNVKFTAGVSGTTGARVTAGYDGETAEVVFPKVD